ncbi:hypothetical protein AVEN_210164-1, partial [Araneus ventricosus]
MEEVRSKMGKSILREPYNRVQSLTIQLDRCSLVEFFLTRWNDRLGTLLTAGLPTERAFLQGRRHRNERSSEVRGPWGERSDGQRRHKHYFELQSERLPSSYCYLGKGGRTGNIG